MINYQKTNTTSFAQLVKGSSPLPWLKYLAFPFLVGFNVLLILPYLWLMPLLGICLIIGKGLSLLSNFPGVNWLIQQFDLLCQFLTRKLMKDERDVPFIKMMFVTPLLIGTLVWQSMTPHFKWELVLLYYVILFGPNKFSFYFRVFVCKHLECHRIQGLYQKQYQFLNRYFEYVLGLFYGNIPELDRCGHVGIHHTENNNYSDHQSPIMWNRSNLLHFLQYVLFGAYWHNSGIGILAYFYQNKRWKLFQRMLIGMFLYYGLMIILCWINWLFGLIYFVIPFLTNNAINAIVGWTWHSFANPNDPDNYYTSTLTIVDGTYNIMNEDYHLSHHLHPSLHWTENHLHYSNNQELYITNNASVFKQTDLLEIFLLMTVFKRFDLLAKCYVDLTHQMSDEEITNLLKDRTRPVKPHPQKPLNSV